MPIEIHIENFINGNFVKCDKYLESDDPSTGTPWAAVPDSGPNEAEMAVRAAKEAFVGWSSVPLQRRSQILMKIADLIENKAEEFARAESRDQGKPISTARTVDIPRAVYNFRCFATSCLHHLDSSRYLDTADALSYTVRTPVGVVVLISPWNLPLYLLTFKIAPALAFGNTIVCKPSEITSVTAWMLCNILNEAGVPHGVVNMVFGTGPRVGDALTTHKDVAAIGFTGSVATANHIRSVTASTGKKLSLELGGKNAGIIFNDADLEKCLPTTIRSGFFNQGEVCLCTSRLFVQKDIYETFVEKFVDQVRKIKVGDPLDESVWMGPLVSKEHLTKVKRYLGIAEKESYNIRCGKSTEKLDLPPAKAQGYYFKPTVITDLPDNSPLMQEEIFGPVVCIVSFETEEEAIRRANDVEYGLSATVWSNDVNKVHRVSRQLQVGTIWSNCWMVRDLNMPFGGMKISGIGREGTNDSKEFFTDVKTIVVKIN